MKESWINISTEQQDELNQYTRQPGWRVVAQGALPGVFPERLRNKIDSALAIAAETSTGGTYLVFSALRVDSKDRAIDMQPLGLIVHSTGVSSSGVFLDHGDWPGRTESAPPEFWEQVNRDGVGDYFYARPPADKTSGTLEDLSIQHRGAFRAAVQAIRNRIDGRK